MWLCVCARPRRMLLAFLVELFTSILTVGKLSAGNMWLATTRHIPNLQILHSDAVEKDIEERNNDLSLSLLLFGRIYCSLDI
jgi:hypothetical protein